MVDLLSDPESKVCEDLDVSDSSHALTNPMDLEIPSPVNSQHDAPVVFSCSPILNVPDLETDLTSLSQERDQFAQTILHLEKMLRDETSLRQSLELEVQDLTCQLESFCNPIIQDETDLAQAFGEESLFFEQPPPLMKSKPVQWYDHYGSVTVTESVHTQTVTVEDYTCQTCPQ